MTTQFINIQKISFAYTSQVQPLFRDLSLHLHRGWTGIIGINGAGKTTLLQLICGQLQPVQGIITGNTNSLYCAQRTDEMPLLFADFLNANCSAVCKLQGKLEIEYDWLYRWDTLSYGERKRVQLAVALWCDPGVLAVDEPTNHLDAAAKQLVQAALDDYRGIGLLVSHDRELLDRLCGQCLFIDAAGVMLRPGSFTEGSEHARQENLHARKQYAQVKAENKRIRQEQVRRREIAARQQALRSKKGIPLKDHDARAKKNRARISGKDGVGGKLLRQLAGRARQQEAQLGQSAYRKTEKSGITITGEEAGRDCLFHFPACSLQLGTAKTLLVAEIIMHPGERIALTGKNGTGKSTLVRYILDRIALPAGKVIYLPQEIPGAVTEAMLATIHSLHSAQLGTVMSAFSRLGSRPERLLDTQLPSPGEARKLVLALGLLQQPQLIIMDEPTNHLDLESICCLEDALDECRCGLLLVSHDRYFLNRLTNMRWQIGGEGGVYRLHVAQRNEKEEEFTRMNTARSG